MQELDMGVTPRLVFFLRQAIDEAWTRWQLPPEWVPRAQAWCRDVKIVVTGGFNPQKIRRFEELGVPADIYGVGSSLFSNSDEAGTNNDFTADVVRVKVNGCWYDLAKVGRRSCANPDLQRVQ
jgi:nicotinate phosphoribosyltransferase